MNSESMYDADRANIVNIKWKQIGDSGWKPFPNPVPEKVIHGIANHLNDSKLYVVTNRNESKEIDKIQLRTLLRNSDDLKDFRIWTRNFRHVVEVRKAYGYRKGETQPNGLEYFLAKLLKAFMRN